ncbi:hypothetical protein CERZMDRAFT_34241 [Cercospora zeae-maydis SCOH1-5]|uniref:Fe2OG dioxygenase domain-containing protein n=1 Tax=Cercospora zeae-maydis SCOH1-5 TaxID=717836 RepID=A0A6A6FRE9_9PEZI|nr:hypothetical protein CERZMDRAFT_34241 [Cercospora zeae-maydis SCOH1-5]
MSSLFAVLSQRSPNLQTRKGLIVVGLQNDFLLPSGKLPVNDAHFVDRIARLAPSFRPHGDVVWVRSEFVDTKPVNNGDDMPGDAVVAGASSGTAPEVPCGDHELFLSRTSTREPCCIRGSHGAEYADRIKPVMESTDLHITKTHYSAFAGTTLLMTLRSRLITDVYICGCMTNLSVYATAMDAARYGIEITLVDDCLGYRLFDRHETAKRQLSDFMDADTVKADALLTRLTAGRADAKESTPLQHRGDTLEADTHKARKGNQTKPTPHAPSSRMGLMARDSPRRISGQPWLEIIPLDYQASFDVLCPIAPAQEPETAVDDAGDLADDLSESQEMDEIMPEPLIGQPLFGEDKAHESAGSRIVHDFMPDAATLFDELHREIKWQTMFHQTGQVPRLVCCQATIDEDGSTPVYRHPSDQTLPVETWTPTVDQIRQEAEKVAGHPLNHALIQLYRNGNDFISEHSDKTLDIVANSSIVNASFGAQRTMRIRTKRDKSSTDPATRTTYRVPMPHNSLILMSLSTNAEYLHAINWDRRPACELTDAEQAYGGQRISLTFRHIGTHLNSDSTLIWGDGAVGKSKSDARTVINGDAAESERLIQAFGSENAASSINWSHIYGSGSDVLHLK